MEGDQQPTGRGDGLPMRGLNPWPAPVNAPCSGSARSESRSQVLTRLSLVDASSGPIDLRTANKRLAPTHLGPSHLDRLGAFKAALANLGILESTSVTPSVQPWAAGNIVLSPRWPGFLAWAQPDRRPGTRRSWADTHIGVRHADRQLFLLTALDRASELGVTGPDALCVLMARPAGRHPLEFGEVAPEKVEGQ